MSLMRTNMMSSLPLSARSLSEGKMRSVPVRHNHARAFAKPVPATEFSLSETHGLEQMRDVSIDRTSVGLGWANACMSVQSQGPFSARLIGAPSILVSVVNSGAARANVTLRGSAMSSLQTMDAAPGSICIIPDNQAFDCELKSRVGWTHLYIGRPLFDQIASDLCQLSPARVEVAPRLGIFDPVLEQLVNGVRDALDERPDLSGLYVDYLLGAIAARLIKKHSNFAEDSKPYAQQERLSARLVDRTRRIIETRLADRLSTADLAEGTGLGADQFGRVFKQASGVSLYQFVIRCRIDRACRLLTDTRLPIVEIAFECGFADQVHLTRAFSRIVGTTPAAYRKGRRDA